MKPIVFLDFDGVLNSWTWLGSQGVREPTKASHEVRARVGFDPKTIRRLNKLLKRTSSSIVVSSAWRKRLSVDGLQDLLSSQGLRGEVIGRTPEIPGPRAREIARWLRLIGLRPYVVLDDNATGMGTIRNKAFSGVRDPRFVLTDIHKGLQDRQLEQAAELLEEQQ